MFMSTTTFKTPHVRLFVLLQDFHPGEIHDTRLSVSTMYISGLQSVPLHLTQSVQKGVVLPEMFCSIKPASCGGPRQPTASETAPNIYAE